MATTGDYATKRGNMVRFNKVSGSWQVLYRPLFTQGQPLPMRVMSFDAREDAVLVLDKMEADGNA